jgi:hypothetical protein
MNRLTAANRPAHAAYRRLRLIVPPRPDCWKVSGEFPMARFAVSANWSRIAHCGSLGLANTRIVVLYMSVNERALRASNPGGPRFQFALGNCEHLQYTASRISEF